MAAGLLPVCSAAAEKLARTDSFLCFAFSPHRLLWIRCRPSTRAPASAKVLHIKTTRGFQTVSQRSDFGNVNARSCSFAELPLELLTVLEESEGASLEEKSPCIETIVLRRLPTRFLPRSFESFPLSRSFGPRPDRRSSTRTRTLHPPEKTYSSATAEWGCASPCACRESLRGVRTVCSSSDGSSTEF